MLLNTLPRLAFVAPCLFAISLANTALSEPSYDQVTVIHGTDDLDSIVEGNTKQRYCSIAIINEANASFGYKYRWKNGANGGSVAATPGRECYLHYIPCDEKVNMNVEFDYDLDEAHDQWKFYLLRPALTFHRTCEDSTKYVFKQIGDDKIDLFKRKK